MICNCPSSWLSRTAIILLALPAYAQDNHAQAASDEECRIVAATLHTVARNPLNTTSFGATCDWQRLGLVIQTTNAEQGWSSFVLPPRFGPDHTSATIEYVDHYSGAHGFVGFSTHDCSARQQDGQWIVSACRTTQIAN